MGVGEGLLDTLVQEAVCRQIGNVSRLGSPGTSSYHADNTTIDITDNSPRVPGGGDTIIRLDDLGEID